VTPSASVDAAQLIARMESVPFSPWHTRCRIVMGSATFFDAFNALSLAFALPVLIRLWHISFAEIGVLISVSYVGQLAGRSCSVGWRRGSGACAAPRRQWR
jgi:putative MFS transporter